MTLQKVITNPASAVQQCPCYNARDMIKDGNQAHITLDGQIYILRITRAGKLILTK